LLFGRAAVDSAREQQFDRSVAELGLRDTVHLLGPLDDTDLAWLYGHTTAFVFPSLYEGFGLPVLEAMASGACVVARNASAMAEIVGEAGALIETADPDALAATISALLDAPERRAQLGAAARQRAAAFTIDRMARLTYASYCAALGSARTSNLDGHAIERD
jgi:glycosyltransferase involved in cell wall biosynthesis